MVTTRIWLDRYVAVEHPANVLSRFDGLRGAGGTFFMLDQLQKDHEVELWGGEEPKGSVLACDFYNGGAVACLSDEDIVALLLDELLPAAVPRFAGARALDAHVVRCPGAVTWFSRGRIDRDRRWRRLFANVVCAGDWVRMGDREHGAKGLCQERAYVSGLEAGNSLLRRGELARGEGREAPSLPGTASWCYGRCARTRCRSCWDARRTRLSWTRSRHSDSTRRGCVEERKRAPRADDASSGTSSALRIIVHFSKTSGQKQAIFPARVPPANENCARSPLMTDFHTGYEPPTQTFPPGIASATMATKGPYDQDTWSPWLTKVIYKAPKAMSLQAFKWHS